MKRLLIALALWLLPSLALAQCNGVFPANTLCGTIAGGIPGQVPNSALTAIAGGTPNQIQYNNAGNLGGFTLGGDCTLVVGTGLITCTKTNNVAFSGLATASIPLSVANGGTGLTGGTSGGVPYYSGAGTIASSGALAAGDIVLGGGTGNPPVGGSGCTIVTGSFTCASVSSSFPQIRGVNSTADATAPLFQSQKTRSGGNTLTNDLFYDVQIAGFANGGTQTAARLIASQTGASSGSNIPTKWQIITSNAAGNLNQTLTFDSGAHLSANQVTAPTAATCTGFALTSGGDFAGKLTMTSGTTCSITFGTAFAVAPACVVSPGSAASTHFATTNTTTLSVTFGTAQTGFSWICVGA